MKYSVVLPAYNEEKRIADCLNILLSTLPENCQVIVAADGCTDKTVEYAKNYPVQIVACSERLGKGGGILNAAKNVETSNIVFCDVDLSVSPRNIPEIAKQLDTADFVVGIRQMTGYPLHRRVLSLGFNLLFRLLFRINIQDTQCGFKAVKKHVLTSLGLKVTGYGFDVELIVKAHRQGCRIREFPVEWHYKEGSKVNVARQVFLWHGSC